MDKRRGGGQNRQAAKQRQLQEIDESNPIMKMFKDFSAELDEKHDRYERIVKLSRDVTIESKRIIFSLHSQDTDIEAKRPLVLQEAEKRLNLLVTGPLQMIANELRGLDAYLYLRAYTAGIQEFIEALLFYQYIKSNTIDIWQVINAKFAYKNDEGDEFVLMFPQNEFVLGLADFTGEMMRKCINNIGSGQVDDCFKICGFVKYILSGFLGTNTAGQKEAGRKLYVLRQSLAKMELVCYNIRVRGSEIPKHMLAIVNTGGPMDDMDDDEGFY